MDSTDAAEVPQEEGNGHYTSKMWMDELECLRAPGAKNDERWPLHSAAATGRADIIHTMLARGYDKDELDEKGCSALQGAAISGHTGVTQALLAAGADMSLRCHGDMSPLDRAAGGGHANIVRMILEHGGDVNAAGANGATPLHRAAAFGKADVVRPLCLNGADVGKVDARGSTPLLLAARGDHAAATQARLAAGAVTGSRSDQEDMSALEQASSWGHVDVMAALIEHGADVNGVCPRGGAALHYAVALRNVDMARVLCLKGSDVDKLSDGVTPLVLAVVANNMAILQALLSAGADSSIRCGEFSMSALDMSVSAGHVESARVLLEHGADVNAARADGTTPLHFAASDDRPEFLSLLCLKGANVDKLDGYGYTPLQWTAIGGNVATARALLVGGADATNRRDEDGMSVLDRAARHGHVDLLLAIIEHGVDVNATGHDGITALHIAARSNQAAAIEVLVRAGVDTEARLDSSLNTPLVCAARRSNVSALVVLLKHGACVSQRNVSKRTALHCAAQNAGKLGTAEAVDFLLRHGADEAAVNRTGCTPADVIGILIDEQDSLPEDVERVRMLLENAPADRAWRRRAFLVLCRAHYPSGRVQLELGSSHEHAGVAKRTRSRAEQSKPEAEWAGVASMLMGVGADPISLMGDGADIIFETIVGFL